MRAEVPQKPRASIDHVPRHEAIDIPPHHDLAELYCAATCPRPDFQLIIFANFLDRLDDHPMPELGLVVRRCLGWCVGDAAVVPARPQRVLDTGQDEWRFFPTDQLIDAIE